VTATATDTLDLLVDATPASRDRYVDFLRALSIAVVVLWHWVFSITHWRHGRLVMPNPIPSVPGLWTLTWVLQIMPVFFFVGGYANAAGWESTGRVADFARRRLRRLYRPVAAFVLAWAAFDVLARLLWPAYPGVLRFGLVVFVPLWFLGVYTGVTLLTPWTHRLHERFGVAAAAALAAGSLLCDVARLRFGIGGAGLVGSACVWLFAHQLGYFYRDGSLLRIGRRLALGGLLALAALTTFGPYERSMVATPGKAVGNMFPTTACIAALAVFQAGLAMLLRPAANRRLAQRRPWRRVIALNSVAMTVFVWHMTALVVVIGALKLAGIALPAHASAGWWLARPLWLAAPGVVLALLVALFRGIEAAR
jgi:fucose 4-O-acetylase-like acetyltransferase